MPNWVSNQIEVSADRKVLVDIMEFIKGEDRPVDFEKIVPIDRSDRKYWTKTWKRKGQVEEKPSVDPERSMVYYNDRHLSVEFVDKQDDPTITNDNGDTFAGYSWNWYDANRDQWGTKWNAVESSVILDGNVLRIFFDTAWSAPLPVIKALVAKFPEAIFQYGCTEESYLFIASGYGNGGHIEIKFLDYEEIFTQERKTEAVRRAISYDDKDPDQYNIPKLVDICSFYIEDFDRFDIEDDIFLGIWELPEDIESCHK